MKSWLIAAALLGTAFGPGQITRAMAEPPTPAVVASIKPIHSLLSMVMGELGQPELLVGGASSPHDYALKPSQARELENADIVFWIGPELETFLEKPLTTIAAKAQIVTLFDDPDLLKLELREGGIFEIEAGADDHDHDHDHDHGHGHDHGSGMDPHVWLAPDNAKVMLNAMAEALGEADPTNAPIYAANAAEASTQLDQMIGDLEALLSPVARQPYVVFHDAYQYFEQSFGLEPAGALTINPEMMPGAERLQTMQDGLRKLAVVCVFSEPQFDPKLVAVISEGSVVRTAVIDPLGADLADGPKLYPQLMRRMATAIRDCLV